MHRSSKISFTRVAIVCIAIAVILGGGWFFLLRDSGAPTNRAGNDIAKNQPSQTTFDKTRYSLADPASPWVIANKRRPLSPIDYAPPLATPNIPLRLAGGSPEMQVSTQMIPALEQLINGAKASGMQLMLASGYRSYQQQITVYNSEVKRFGQVTADRESARPGHSEHQTGLAADIEPVNRQCEIAVCFGDLAEGKWLAAHAYEYGFIIRYPNGSEPTTGYTYEPWHIRYVGVNLSKELHAQGSPLLEDFFSLGAAPNYN